MSRPSRGSASYRAVLTLPHAPRLFTAAMFARLSYGVIGLPLLLTLYEGTGSYAVAGTVAGLFGLVTALLGPARARLVERLAALTWLSVSYTALLAAAATACAAHAPTALIAALGLITGVFPPPVGPLMRTLWGRLVADEAQRQSALSLDTAAESTVFALGPLLGGLLVAALGAPAALGVCTLLVLTGFGLLAAALRGVPGSVCSGGVRSGNPLRVKGFRPMLLPVLGAAAAFSVCELAIVVARGTVAAGVLTTLFAVGGVLGGLLYGGHRWRGPLRRRPVLLVAAAACCYAVPAVDALAATAMALLCAGACTDVLLITAYQLVEELVPEGARTEAGAWVNTAYNLGAAFGAAAGGVLVDRAGPVTAFGGTAGMLVCCAAAGAAATLGAVRRRPSPAGA